MLAWIGLDSFFGGRGFVLGLGKGKGEGMEMERLGLERRVSVGVRWSWG